MQLSPECARVLGALVEKSLTTPQQYPLTLNSLQAACNQASNREPVVSYDESVVHAALHELKDLRLVRFVLPSHGRSVVRYRHVLDETLALDSRQCAVLAVLLLRGPQTVAELRTRTERMARFEGPSEIEHELGLLGSRDQPLTESVGRRPGQKEGRWATPLAVPPDGAQSESAPSDSAPSDSAPSDGAGPARAGDDVVDGVRTELAALRAEVAELRAEVAELRLELGELRSSLGG